MVVLLNLLPTVLMLYVVYQSFRIFQSSFRGVSLHVLRFRFISIVVATLAIALLQAVTPSYMPKGTATNLIEIPNTYELESKEIRDNIRGVDKDIQTSFDEVFDVKEKVENYLNN